MITAAPDTTLMDGRPVCVTLARKLQVGDVIQAHGCADLTVTNVQRYERHGLIVAEYDCPAGSGARTMVASSFVFIQPRSEEAEH